MQTALHICELIDAQACGRAAAKTRGDAQIWVFVDMTYAVPATVCVHTRVRVSLRMAVAAATTVCRCVWALASLGAELRVSVAIGLRIVSRANS